MTARGRILIADDEPTFLASAADLLRREGYHVATALDADAALASSREGDFDLLVSDLEMPGNADMRLVRAVAEEVPGMPVIILTGYPSADSAIAAIELPVAAYFRKPVDWEQLLPRVDEAISRFRMYRTMRRTEDQLAAWREEYHRAATPSQMVKSSNGNEVDAFLALTLRNVIGSLSSLESLSGALTGRGGIATPCQLMNCPRGLQLQQAVRETIMVLEETRNSFKSKALGDLRKRLELLLTQV